MNTRIARRLNEARKDEKTLKKAGQEVVDAHNVAVACGYIELPHLTFMDCAENGIGVEVDVAPKCGMVSVDDLYNLKTVWGADRVEVYFDLNNGGYIGIIFKMK
jgi:hypothetical protein